MPYLCLLQEGEISLPRLIEKAQQNNFTVIAAPINSAEVPQEFQREPLIDKQAEFTYSDLLLNSDQWNGKVISILSNQIDCDSADRRVRLNSEEVLQRDISWSEHLQYGGYTLIRLKSGRNINLARVATNRIKG